MIWAIFMMTATIFIQGIGNGKAGKKEQIKGANEGEYLNFKI